MIAAFADAVEVAVPRHSSVRVACLLIGLTALAVSLLSSHIDAQSQAPGGFVERATDTDVRPMLTPAQIQSLLPERGLFTFPSPYFTQAVRITNASDCAGADCVWYAGYSYWRNMNNHVGSDTMYIFVGVDEVHGGPTLFGYNKVTDTVTKIGPLFDAGSQWAASTGEGWYFSATLPTTMYVNRSVTSTLERYDVVTRAFTTVFDVASRPDLFGPNRYIWQFHSSNDDRVHSATLRDAATFAELGCLAYREDTQQFFYFPQRGFAYDECQIDKSGTWLLIKEKLGTDPASEVDNRIIDLDTGAETQLLDRDGAGGHSDNGYSYMVAADNWNSLPNAIRLWHFGPNPIVPGNVVYHDPQWQPGSVNHVSHANTRSDIAAEQQYVCGSGANAVNGPRTNEIVCFMLDGSLRTLVVAPVMTDMNAPGGGDTYAKYPKGNLDVTGQYFMWTTNMSGGRQDAFIVKVPSQLLTSPTSDTTPPAVAITAPANGSIVVGSTTVTATASDNIGVVGVQFKLDGANLGAEVMNPPYARSWVPSVTASGQHVLTAVGRDAAGNTRTSSPVSVIVIGRLQN